MTVWLIDKSALLSLASTPQAEEWAIRIERGLVAMSTVTRRAMIRTCGWSSAG